MIARSGCPGKNVSTPSAQCSTASAFWISGGLQRISPVSSSIGEGGLVISRNLPLPFGWRSTGEQWPKPFSTPVLPERLGATTLLASSSPAAFLHHSVGHDPQLRSPWPYPPHGLDRLNSTAPAERAASGVQVEPSRSASRGQDSASLASEVFSFTRTWFTHTAPSAVQPASKVWSGRLSAV